MNVRTRIAAAGFAAAVLLSPVVASSAQADVPLAGPLVPAVAPSAQATAAATYIADQWRADQSFSNGALADAIASLAATGLHGDVLDEMNTALKSQAASYATNPGAAGKVAIAALALGEDPASYGGVNLVQVITDGLTAAPDAGGIFSLPYAVIALLRADQVVPQASIDALLDAQDASGAFGYLATWETPPVFTVDGDSTGVAITALVGLELSAQGGQDVTDALDAAIIWAQTSQAADGSWAGYSPANATALIGQGLIAAGEDVAAAQAYLVDQQSAVGGAGLPSTHDGTAPNLMATIQGLLLLAGDDLLNVTVAQATEPVTTPPVTTTAPTTTAPSSSAPSVSTAPSATPTAEKPSALPNTGADGAPVALLVGLAVASAGATALLAHRRTR